MEVVAQLEHAGSVLPDLLVYHPGYRQAGVPLEPLRPSDSEDPVIALRDPVVLHRLPEREYAGGAQVLPPAAGSAGRQGNVP